MLKAASTWLKPFKSELDNSGGDTWLSGGDLSQLSKTKNLTREDLELSISFAKDLFQLVPDMMEEKLGFSALTLEYFTAYGFEK